MAVEVRLPRFSEEMTEATVSRWLKHVGDSVDKGEPLVEVETEKVIVEVEAPSAGVIVQVVAEEQDVVPVDGVLCLVGQAGEAAAGPQATPSASSQEESPPPDAVEPEVQPLTGESGESLPSSIPPSPSPVNKPGPTSPPEGETSRAASSTTVSSKAASSTTVSSKAVAVSPLARRVAEELAIDLTTIIGTGIGGKIVMADLQPYLDRQAPSSSAGLSPAPAGDRAPTAPPAMAKAPEVVPGMATGVAPQGSGQTRIAPSSLRRTIARRLSESKRTIPHFYMTAEIDVTDALILRERFNAGNEDVRISVNDLLIKAVAMALARTPALNATYDEEAVTRHDSVHVGFATAIDEGLVTPVVRDCHLKSVGRIAGETAWLIDQARARKLTTEHMEGGTFTISNLGMYPVVEFSAIINPPQVGILAIARPEDKPAAVNGRLVNRKAMRVTLSADHRAVDGITGAEFLAALKGLLERPEGLML